MRFGLSVSPIESCCRLDASQTERTEERKQFIEAASGRLEDRVALSQGMMPAVAAQVGQLAVGARQARTLDLRGTSFGIAVPTTGGAKRGSRR